MGYDRSCNSHALRFEPKLFLPCSRLPPLPLLPLPPLALAHSTRFAFLFISTMPSPRAHTRNANAGRVSDKSVSFYGRGGGSLPAPEKIRRPRTLPDLVVRDGNVASLVASPTAAASPKPKLTKVLLNVTVQGSVGAVQVLTSPESRVRDLISATLKQYLKEGRRPVISGSSVDDFDLHYSQFSLESNSLILSLFRVSYSSS